MENQSNMNEQDEKKIKEFIFQAVQSGKKETSNLVDDIFKRMDEHISKSMEVNFNGKIKEVVKKLDAQNIVMDQHIKSVGKHIEEDTEWKEDTKKWREGVTPAILVMEKTMNFAGVGQSIIKGFILLGAGVTAVYGIIKLFFNKN